MSYNECQGCISGVNCKVSGCKYHAKGDICTAGSIDVKSENATRRAETFCGTFQALPHSDGV